MPDTVIKIENLSKRYRLGLIGSDTLKDDLIMAGGTARPASPTNKKKWDVVIIIKNYENNIF